MENGKPSMIELLVEAHAGLDRQGPGSVEATCQALAFLDDVEGIRNVADLGCGTGPQTMLLAQKLSGTVIGLDMFPDFIDVLNRNAESQGVSDRVKGIVGSMDDLPFEKESLDLVWSEGAIDNVGFEKALAHWHGFLRDDGYVAVTCPSWLTHERPEAVETFWSDAGSGLDTVERNVEAMQRCGYRFVAAFALPETCWTDNYFAPREAALEKLVEKYGAEGVVGEFVAENRREVELYARYKQHYGYVFYIGRKL